MLDEGRGELAGALKRARERSGKNIYEASRDTGVSRSNLPMIESGERGLTPKTLHDIAAGYGTMREETAILFLMLARDRILAEMEGIAIWLFLAVADEAAYERIAAAMAEDGHPTNPRLARAILETMAERPGYERERAAVMPLILQTLTINLRQRSLIALPGEVLTGLMEGPLAVPTAGEGEYPGTRGPAAGLQ
jgi:transcriptional regulator with XRE-family HTH domain